MKFTKPLFSSDEFLCDCRFVIAEQNGQLLKSWGSLVPMLGEHLKFVSTGGVRPLYAIRVKVRHGGARLCA